jgi:hypothetical protein
MGKRDYRHRETKKAKKGGKRPVVSDIVPAPVTPEVVKRGKKEKGSGEEEE